jgi:hypothetical protein
MVDKPLTPTQKVEQLMSQAEPLIDQVNNLYNQFATGVERLAPIQKRSQLEALVNQLQAIPKTNETYKFRVQTVISRYNSMKDRWDRLLKDVDSGKIKRITGPLAKK